MRIIPQPFVKGSLLTLLYIVLFIFYQGNIAGQEMAINLPFVALSYFFLFNLGNPDIQIMMEKQGFLTPQKSSLKTQKDF